MPDIIKRSEWNRQFKSYDKTSKRLMTGAEAAEYNADKKEQAEAREKRIQTAETFVLSLNADWTIPLRASPPPAAEGGERAEKEEREEEEAEVAEAAEAAEKAFIPSSSTAPAAMTQLRAGRKRAPTMKALEAEMVPKQSRAQARKARQGREGWGKGKKEDRGGTK